MITDAKNKVREHFSKALVISPIFPSSFMSFFEVFLFKNNSVYLLIVLYKTNSNFPGCGTYLGISVSSSRNSSSVSGGVGGGSQGNSSGGGGRTNGE